MSGSTPLRYHVEIAKFVRPHNTFLVCRVEARAHRPIQSSTQHRLTFHTPHELEHESDSWELELPDPLHGLAIAAHYEASLLECRSCSGHGL